MNKNVQRGQATRAHLIAVATRLFTEHGYDGTSIEAVLAESGVSRGSLYHHFPGKDALFLAVMETVGAKVAEDAMAAVKDIADPVELLQAGFLAWIRMAGDPTVRQILLIDAQTVLGWRRWREADEPSLGLTRSVLAGAADAGLLDRRHVDVFAHILLAAGNELALMIALADDPAAALVAGENAARDFLDRLLARPGPASDAGRRPE
jgi:AcrR family transcriptional regulator